jgi:hypothetical protein
VESRYVLVRQAGSERTTEPNRGSVDHYLLTLYCIECQPYQRDVWRHRGHHGTRQFAWKGRRYRLPSKVSQLCHDGTVQGG